MIAWIQKAIGSKVTCAWKEIFLDQCGGVGGASTKWDKGAAESFVEIFIWDQISFLWENSVVMLGSAEPLAEAAVLAGLDLPPFSDLHNSSHKCKDLLPNAS